MTREEIAAIVRAEVANLTRPVMFYDQKTDELRPVTQRDLDYLVEVQKCFTALRKASDGKITYLSNFVSGQLDRADISQ